MRGRRRNCYENVILMKDVRALKDARENTTLFYQKIQKIENLRQNVCSKLRSVREILDRINN